MNIQKLPLASLKLPDRNVRMHTEAQLKEFERSVTMFGQIRPIVCDDSLTILAGNGLYETLVRMGREEADVLVVHDLSENQKKKLMLADNRIYSLGVDDLDTFDAFLAELADDLDIPGYDEEILSSMVSDAEDITEQLQEYGTLDEEVVEEIREAGERKAQNIEKASQEPEPQAPVVTQVHEETSREEPDGPAEAEPIQRYVVCPKCGEKIWL